MKWVALLMAVPMLVCADDLDAIRETQKKLVALRGKNPETRDAVPELTVLKHQLRDWAESRILNAGSFTDVRTFAAALNAEFDLKKAIVPPSGDDQNLLGDVAPFEISHPDGDSTWLQLDSGVGVECEYDESLYLYEWREGHWNRRYELEQNDYTQDKYLPRHYDHVEVSAQDSAGNRLLLTVANTLGCASVWQSLIYRVDRIGSKNQTLLDGASVFNLGDAPGSLSRLEENGALMEFEGGSFDPNVMVRPHVLHFEIDGDKARRTEPLALTAQDFVDEWILSKWDDIAEWTNPALQERHESLAKPDAESHFTMAQRCLEPANQWQIEIDSEDNKSGDVTKYYFLLAQPGPYSFRMVDISTGRQPGCPGNSAPMSMAEPRPTLFPKK